MVATVADVTLLAVSSYKHWLQHRSSIAFRRPASPSRQRLRHKSIHKSRRESESVSATQVALPRPALTIDGDFVRLSLRHSWCRLYWRRESRELRFHPS